MAVQNRERNAHTFKLRKTTLCTDSVLDSSLQLLCVMHSLMQGIFLDYAQRVWACKSLVEFQKKNPVP